MPTYEYVCSKCGHQFEKVQSMKEDALTVCPKELCPRKTWGRGKVKRAVGSGAGLIFKGSGFYLTDYRSEGYKAAAKKESSAAAGETKSGGESKPAGDAKKSAPAAPAKAESKAATPAPKSK